MLTRFISLRGYKLAASDGEIGQVRQFYFDDQTWDVQYLAVDTGDWLLYRTVLIIPEVLGLADPQTGSIAVRLTKQAIREAPLVDTRKPVSRQNEEALHRHYQWQPYWSAPAGAAWTAVVPPIVPPDQQRLVETVQCSPISPEKEEPDADSHLRSSAEIAGRYDIRAIDGEIGRVHDFVLDDEEWKVRFLVVRTGTWFFNRDVLVAPDWAIHISYRDREVLVNLPRAAIEDAPPYDPDSPISRAFEERLCNYYQQRRYWAIPEAAGKVS